MPQEPPPLTDSQRRWIAKRFEEGVAWEDITARLRQAGYSPGRAEQIAEEILQGLRRKYAIKGTIEVVCGAAILGAAILTVFFAVFAPSMVVTPGTCWNILGGYVCGFFPLDIALIARGIEDLNRCSPSRPPSPGLISTPGKS